MKELIKKGGLLLMSVFLISQSYKLIENLPNFTSGGILAFLIAFLLNLFVLGVFAFAGFALPTQKLFPESYYKVKNSKRLKKWNKLLKMEYFRKFLLATVWRDKNQQKGYFDGTKAGIEKLIVNSKKSEFGHLIPFWILNGLVIYILVLGSYQLAFWTFFINVFANLYPILLQQDHRRRIDILKRRMNR